MGNVAGWSSKWPDVGVFVEQAGCVTIFLILPCLPMTFHYF